MYDLFDILFFINIAHTTTSTYRHTLSLHDALPISNLKKKPSQSAARGYSHKARAISECGAALGQSLNAGWLQFATLVPIPCSKTRDHADYDDRIRSEEHTSELQSLMRNSYAAFCLKKQKKHNIQIPTNNNSK